MKKIIGYMLYVFAIILALYNVYFELSLQYFVNIRTKIIVSALLCIAFLIPTIYLCKVDPKQSKRYKRILFSILFVYYLWLLLNMLLFDNAFNRGINAANNVTLEEYLRISANFKPFYTIKNYIYTYLNGNISGTIVAINIIGNLFAFAPMGFFLPVLFKKMRNFFVFSFTTAAAICIVELLQMTTRTGSCDVDDFILNFTGAIIIYILTFLPSIRRLRT